ncbi:rhodanese-related sulfurtransferase [Bradyrhizobium yuanmingense]|uniref:Rhodanese-related sulfurtransferase n=1 Tax=Bradyrhizobium yuanmingense TaxID=108015 RepID=A0ABV4GUR3_9BRAD
MSTFTTISSDKMARLIGTANAPVLIDVRTEQDFAADRRLIPGSIKLGHDNVADWGGAFAGRRAVVSCLRGEKLAQGTAAWLRQLGAQAETLEGGFEGWKAAKLPLVDARKLPPRDAKGRTVWVTRARPKVDRIACPWLIRRFVDPGAVFLYVAPSEVVAVGERFGAAPFDIENVFWSHRGELCTFDVMIEEFGIATAPLLRLATLVRGAPTPRDPTSRRRRPACSRPRSGCRASMTTTSSSSRPACCSMMPSTAGAATPPPRLTTGRPTR